VTPVPCGQTGVLKTAAHSYLRKTLGAVVFVRAVCEGLLRRIASKPDS
jgi:hypothetical protein